MIDLSADMGEGAPGEAEIWPLITSANVACGGHAGDEASMREAADRAREHGVALGAHPSYPDRANFGRQTMRMDPADLRTSIVEQIEAFRSIAQISFVKAHGALYNDAHRDRSIADVLIDAIASVDETLAVVCGAGSEMARAAADRGLRIIREAFADRSYESDGSLTPRSMPGSLLAVDEAARQARLLASEGVVIARTGERVSVAFDTLCLHADMDRAVERIRAVRAALSFA